MTFCVAAFIAARAALIRAKPARGFRKLARGDNFAVSLADIVLQVGHLPSAYPPLPSPSHSPPTTPLLEL